MSLVNYIRIVFNTIYILSRLLSGSKFIKHAVERNLPIWPYLKKMMTSLNCCNCSEDEDIKQVYTVKLSPKNVPYRRFFYGMHVQYSQ